MEIGTCSVNSCSYVDNAYSIYSVSLYYGHFGTLILVLITEVSSIQRSFSTPQYYTGTQNSVLIIEVSAIQRFVIERSHCIYIMGFPQRGYQGAPPFIFCSVTTIFC